MIAIRSLLYVPAAQPRMLAKLPGLPADAVLLDLEDGVAPTRKDEARENLRRVAREGRLAGCRQWMLRVNSPSSYWHADDLDLARELRPAVTFLPKAEEAEHVRRLGRHCERWSGRVGLILETARGIGLARSLAGAHPGVELLAFGSADYRRSLGARPGPGREWEMLALQEILLAARMHGCQAIDSVYFRFRDEQGLTEHGRVARELGYDGKSCIHPHQVGPIHRLFSSTEDEIAWARAVEAAWREQQGDARGVAVLDGEMIESLHLEVAARIRSRAPGDRAGEERTGR